MRIRGPLSAMKLEEAAEVAFMDLELCRGIIEKAPGVRLHRGYVELPRIYHGDELAAWIRSTWGPFGPLGIYDLRAWNLFKILGYRIPGPGD